MSADARRQAELLFQQRSVAEIREIEARTGKDIELKQHQLRQLVGNSYRDLIGSADTIVSISHNCETILGNVVSIQQEFAGLAHGFSSADGLLNERRESFTKHEELYAVGGRIKYLVDTPEVIWGFLDVHQFTDAGRRFLRAQIVHQLLQTSCGQDTLARFPLLKHQWPVVEKFKGQIEGLVNASLSSEATLTSQQAADCLIALSALGNLDSHAALRAFLGARRAWVNTQLAQAQAKQQELRARQQQQQQHGVGEGVDGQGVTEQGQGGEQGQQDMSAHAQHQQHHHQQQQGGGAGAAASQGSGLGNAGATANGSSGGNDKGGGAGGGEDGSAVDAAAGALAGLVQAMQSIICQVGELFLAGSSTIGAKAGADAGGCMLQALAWEDEVATNDLQFGMNHASNQATGPGAVNGANRAQEHDACGIANKALQARLSALAPHVVEQACSEWVQQIAQDCAQRCPPLLQACTSAADLVAVEGAVHAAMAAWPQPYGAARSQAATTTQDGRLAPTPTAVGTAVPQSAESWGAVCERVLGVPPFPLWRVVLQPPFAGRAKELLAARFSAVAAAVQTPLATCLAEASKAKAEPAGEVASKGWPMVAPASLTPKPGHSLGTTHVNGKSSSTVPWSERLGPARREGKAGAADDDKGFRLHVHTIRHHFDEELLAALQAALLLLLGPRLLPAPHSHGLHAGATAAHAASTGGHMSSSAVGSRVAELEPFVHSQCMDMVAQLASSCRTQVQGLGTPAGDATAGANTAEQLLAVGRLCSALATESRYLQVVLGPADSWRQAVAQARHASTGLQHPGRSTAAAMRSAAAMAARGAAAGGKLQAAVGQLRGAAMAAYRLWAGWAGACLASGLCARVLADECLMSHTTPLSWQETVVPGGSGGGGANDGLDGGDALFGDGGGQQDMRFMLPACPSHSVMALLHGACQEVRRAGDHAAAPEALQALEWEVAGAALDVYARLLRVEGSSMEDGPDESEGQLANGNSGPSKTTEASAAARLATSISEKGVLQLLMDVRFMRDVLAGGRPIGQLPHLHHQQQQQQQQLQLEGGGTEATDSYVVTALMERRRQGTSVEQHLQDRLDPIDWATYEPHLWANVQHYYQRTATLLGLLTQLQRAYPEGAAAQGRTSATTASAGGRARDLNPMNVLPVAPRFQYLPISIPSVSKGPSCASTHALSRLQTSALSASNGNNSYSFADLGLAPKRAQTTSGGMGQRVGDMASVLASGGNVDSAAMHAAAASGDAGAGASALGGWNARFQAGSFGSLGGILGEKAAEMTALAQQRFEHLSEPSSFSGLLSSFAKTTFR